MDHPYHGCKSVSMALRMKGISVSKGQVERVLNRYGLNTADKRLEQAKIDNIRRAKLSGLVYKPISPMIDNSPGKYCYQNYFRKRILKVDYIIYYFIDLTSWFIITQVEEDRSNFTSVHFIKNSVLPFYKKYRYKLDVIYWPRRGSFVDHYVEELDSALRETKISAIDNRFDVPKEFSAGLLRAKDVILKLIKHFNFTQPNQVTQKNAILPEISNYLNIGIMDYNSTPLPAKYYGPRSPDLIFKKKVYTLSRK
jgi:hypothetical protein